ncbi:MAG TPA: hypothetical protein VGN57_06650 [Pirellulaceae bacterium]|jgi:hypothetical protein|nr:hypothetical protein [Pirellulaceae bacterium]
MHLERSCLLILGAVVLLLGCRQPVEPPVSVAERAPASIVVNGKPWGRLAGNFADDARLQRLFRERKELADSPDLGGTLVVYASPTGERVRFFWIQAWSDSDGWTWIETDRDGKYVASGQGVGVRFPGS